MNQLNGILHIQKSPIQDKHERTSDKNLHAIQWGLKDDSPSHLVKKTKQEKGR